MDEQTYQILLELAGQSPRDVALAIRAFQAGADLARQSPTEDWSYLRGHAARYERFAPDFLTGYEATR